MVDHLCKNIWVSGPVGNCPHHTQRGQSAADVRPYDDRRARNRTEGIAKTGQVSKKGTVTHTDYWSGKLSVIARPSTIHHKLSTDESFREKWIWRNGRWIHRQTGNALQWQTTVSSSASEVGLASAVLGSLRQGGSQRSSSPNPGIATSPVPSGQPVPSIETSSVLPSRRIVE